MSATAAVLLCFDFCSAWDSRAITLARRASASSLLSVSCCCDLTLLSLSDASSASSSATFPSSIRRSTMCLSRSSCSACMALSSILMLSAACCCAAVAHRSSDSSSLRRTTARRAKYTSARFANPALACCTTSVTVPVPPSSPSSLNGGGPARAARSPASTAVWKETNPEAVRESPLVMVRRCISASSCDRICSNIRVISEAKRSHSAWAILVLSSSLARARSRSAARSRAAAFSKRSPARRELFSLASSITFSRSCSNFSFSSARLFLSACSKSTSDRSRWTSSATLLHSATPLSSHSFITAFSSRRVAICSFFSWISCVAWLNCWPNFARFASKECFSSWKASKRHRSCESSSWSMRFSSCSRSRWLFTCCRVRCREATCSSSGGPVSGGCDVGAEGGVIEVEPCRSFLNPSISWFSFSSWFFQLDGPPAVAPACFGGEIMAENPGGSTERSIPPAFLPPLPSPPP
eukprot:Sspe_Gene.45467::Locus_22524_Transcript_1_1_Confidence_1.000_Length_2183::g.45467::m.45467